MECMTKPNLIARRSWTAAVLLLMTSRSHVVSFSVNTPSLGISRAGMPLRRQSNHPGMQKFGCKSRRFVEPVLSLRTLSMAATIDDASAEASAELPPSLSLNVKDQTGRFVTLELDTELPSALLQGRTVTFGSGTEGVVLWQRLPLVFVLTDEKSPAVAEGTTATLDMQRNFSVPVSDEVLGRVVDYMGRPLDGGSDLPADTPAHLFGESTKQADMATISKPLHTGITAVDSLTPIGKGQNMLVVGSERLGRRELALDAVVHQATEGVQCVYVSTTGKHEQVVKALEERGAMKNTVVVVADAADSIEAAARGLAAAAAGATFGEFFRKKGNDVLVVVDDLDRYKEVWDATERALLQMFGAEMADEGGNLAAANSEMRAFYSALCGPAPSADGSAREAVAAEQSGIAELAFASAAHRLMFQRVGFLNTKAGGGSMSMMMLLDRPSTNEGGKGDKYTLEDFDEAIYGGKVIQRVRLMQERGIDITNEVLAKLGIPTPGKDAREVKFKLQHIDELISLSDGQIILNEKLFSQGLRPAMDSTASVTRIGIGADNLAVPSSAAMRQVAARLRFDLAQSTDIPPDDESPAARKQRARTRAWQAVLQQEWGATRGFAEEIMGLLAASQGLLDAAFIADSATPLGEAQERLQQAVAHAKGKCAEEVEELVGEQQLSVKAKRAILAALEEGLASK